MKPLDFRNRVASCRALAFTGSIFLTFSAASHAAELIAIDGMMGDNFGYSVALSGNTGIVGAIYKDESDIDSGSAYLFRGLDSASDFAVQNAKLLASDGALNDYFGSTVSISGSIGLLGAYGDDDQGADSGSAYVFRGLDTATGTVLEHAKLNASDGAAEDWFGSSVSISGNIGLVGAYSHDLGFEGNAGSAYVFRGLDIATGMVNENAKLLASDGTANRFLGATLSLSGSNALVGAQGDDTYGLDSGSAYVFRGLDTATGTVFESVKLLASDGAAGDYFSSSLSLSGGIGLVGAVGDDDNGSVSGSAYVFRGLDTATGIINESAKLVASDAQSSAFFGTSVSLSGGNGLVGANGQDAKGAAYLFQGLDTATGTVNESVKLVASDGEVGDVFGWSVAIDGDNFLISEVNGHNAVDSGKAYSGSVSSVTVMDAGATHRTISGISFTTQGDWIIGETTDGNSVKLSAGDTATVMAAGMEVSIGKDAGSDSNTLNIAGILAANTVNIGAPIGNSGNMLKLNATADITNAVAFIMSQGNLLSIEGDLTAAGALLTYLDTTTLQVWNGASLETVANGNQSALLSSVFSGGYTIFTAVPEPSALLLSAFGMLGLLRRRR